MNRLEILDKIIEIYSRVSTTPVSEVRRQVDSMDGNRYLDDKLNLDSLDRVEVCMEIEEAFSLEIVDSEMDSDKIRKVDNLVEFIQGEQAQNDYSILGTGS